MIAVAVSLPEHRTASSWTIEMKAGTGETYKRKVILDRTVGLQTFLVPFATGDVSFEVKQGEETMLEGDGESITSDATEIYNSNAWTGHWGRKVS